MVTRSQLLKMLVVIAFGAILWFLPHTEAINQQGWHLLAVFAATILSFILRPWPIGVMAFFGIAFAVGTHTIEMKEALGGYTDANVWLIVSAVFFSRGLINSGLGKRIAYTLIKYFGTSSLGVGASSIQSFRIFPSALVLALGKPLARLGPIS